MAENNETKSLVTARQVMRVLAIIGIVVVFCPGFLVSCSGQSMNVSVMTAVKGISIYGETIAKPQPLMLICLLLPIAILALLFVKNISEKQAALIIAVCGILDFVIWFIFKSVVKSIAEKNYCEFKTTGWYLLNNLLLLFIIIFAVLILLQKLEMDTDILSVLSGGGTQGALNKMSDSLTKMSGAVNDLAGKAVSKVEEMEEKRKAEKKKAEEQKKSEEQKKADTDFCEECGSELEKESKFCSSCGAKVPEKKPEAVEEKPKFCQECGKPLDSDAVFCKHCGTKC